METWILVMALVSGSSIGSPIAELGPMPDLQTCLDTAAALQRASKLVFAGCTVKYAASKDEDEDAAPLDWNSTSVGSSREWKPPQ